jgi:hypothetical protein
MIDDRNQVERLVPKLREALPLIATLSPPLGAVVREESPDAPDRCAVTRVDYAGDEGGIMCALLFRTAREMAIETGRCSCPSRTFDSIDASRGRAKSLRTRSTKRLRIVNAIPGSGDL